MEWYTEFAKIDLFPVIGKFEVIALHMKVSRTEIAKTLIGLM